MAGMKTTHLFLFAAVLWSNALNCQADDLVTLVVPPGTGTRYSDTTIVLAAGDSAKVEFSGYNGNNYNLPPTLEIQIGAWVFDHPTWGNPQYAVKVAPVFAGPATIKAKNSQTNAIPCITTISIQRANAVANVVPANAVVIPEDANGQYQVILESSTDLLNWTAANPGTYGGSTAQRFFRTRIVKQN